MPFYETDNINTFIFSLITEEYEFGYDQEDMWDMIDDASHKDMIDWVEEKLKEMIGAPYNNLVIAVSNTIDYDIVKKWLADWSLKELCEDCHAYTGGTECEPCKEKELDEENSGGE